ncbi:MAG: GTP-binding protein [Nostocaceae cyanobacterium]|nr:GTP-binding protein [Nostocaceae cyanobacterium]
MNIPEITVVAGFAGSGKTAWIRQQVQNVAFTEDKSIIYFSPGTGNVPIDQTVISAEFPQIQVFRDGEEVEFTQQIPSAKLVYIEIGFYLELGSLSGLLEYFTHRKVAVLPVQIKDSEYHHWADEIIPGIPTKTDLSAKLWRVVTEGQVVDEDSLEEFWYELIHGAYGDVSRGKAIFDVNDGRSIYCDFVAGIPPTEFLELNFPRHLTGRPQRFSGIEVVGKNLDETILKQTLSDCCLSDTLILQYQQQVREILSQGMEL